MTNKNVSSMTRQQNNFYNVPGILYSVPEWTWWLPAIRRGRHRFCDNKFTETPAKMDRKNDQRLSKAPILMIWYGTGKDQITELAGRKLDDFETLLKDFGHNDLSESFLNFGKTGRFQSPDKI